MEDPKVILIIDDEVDIVTMLKGLLKSRGYCVLTAHNGKEGLQRIAETKPHLIILDINMPEMDGASFYEHIYDRVNKKVKYPVLVLTARTQLGELFVKLDIDGFMSKPFELDIFMREIEIIMKKRYGMLSETAPGKKDDLLKKKSPQNLLVIEDDQEAFNKIVLAFANCGYTLSVSRTGVAGLERAMMNPPDMILIKLGLPDLSGDIVALKLKRMPKTMDIPLILYRPYNVRGEYSVESSLCEKAGIDRLIESDDPQVLLKELERKWREKSDLGT
jgi:DNA-binding response OmpR family regulator